LIDNPVFKHSNNSHASHGPPLTLHLYVTVALALNVSRIPLQGLTVSAATIKRGGRGGGGCVGGGGVTMIGPRVRVCLILGRVLVLHITCINRLPALTF